MAVDPVTGLNAVGGSLALQGPLTIAGGMAVKKLITGTASLTFGSISTLTGSEQPITVTGATTGSAVFASPATDLGNTGLSWCARVSATDTVQVRVTNDTVGSVTPNVVAWIAVVIQ